MEIGVTTVPNRPYFACVCRAIYVILRHLFWMPRNIPRVEGSGTDCELRHDILLLKRAPYVQKNIKSVRGHVKRGENVRCQGCRAEHSTRILTALVFLCKPKGMSGQNLLPVIGGKSPSPDIFATDKNERKRCQVRFVLQIWLRIGKAGHSKQDPKTWKLSATRGAFVSTW